ERDDIAAPGKIGELLEIMPVGLQQGRDLAGAINAALFAASLLALEDKKVAGALAEFRAAQTEKVLSKPDPRKG
ncbi:MAG TPA: hypothetical protein VHQ21_06590, partial [Rhodanobacteraceae bacterium]|nr:hypothetical protein [Rhodanobacteraceae bacterium]